MLWSCSTDVGVGGSDPESVDVGLSSSTSIELADDPELYRVSGGRADAAVAAAATAAAAAFADEEMRRRGGVGGGRRRSMIGS